MTDTPQSITIRHPTASDGAAMHALVRSLQALDDNSCYTYLLLATHFADTCLVAESEGHLVGLVAAYRPPTKPHVVFVWQIGISPTARRQGLASRLLHQLVKLPACQSATHLEQTVGVSNQASRGLFMGFAKKLGVPCERLPHFEAAHFGGTQHEAEELIRIGPLQHNP